MRTLLAAVQPQRGERARLALSVLLASAATGAAIALLATSGYLISRAAQRPLIVTLMVTITAVRTFGIVRAALRYSERLASHDVALRQLARLRTGFYRRLAPLVPGQLRGRSRGELLARFVSDVDTLQDAHLRVAIPSLVALLVIIGAGVAGWLMVGTSGLVVPIALGAAAIASWWVSATVAVAAGRRQAGARARMTAQLVEAMDGSAELALAGRAGEHVRQLKTTDAVLARLARRDALAGALAGGLQSALTGVGLIAVLVVALASAHAGALPGVLVAALAFLFLGACEALLPLPTAARRLRACSVAAARLEDVCDHAAEISDPASPTRPTGVGDLALEHVTMRYGTDEAPVLVGADLRLAAGEKVALIGPSGAGKTTLAELLVRFRDPDQGRVTLDGIDARRLSQDDLRRAVLLCDQDAHLFNTTIRENLLIGRRDAAEAALWHALEAVELEQFVHALPDGLDTRVGQQGELLSGGQRQRLALARALLADSRFLILDEPVAHLDAPLARRVLQRVLALASEGRAVLAITHAVDALDGFDRVLELDDGALREAPTTTTPTELPAGEPLAQNVAATRAAEE